jgi:hypothetical protein
MGWLSSHHLLAHPDNRRQRGVSQHGHGDFIIGAVAATWDFLTALLSES